MWAHLECHGGIQDNEHCVGTRGPHSPCGIDVRSVEGFSMLPMHHSVVHGPDRSHTQNLVAVALMSELRRRKFGVGWGSCLCLLRLLRLLQLLQLL